MRFVKKYQYELLLLVMALGTTKLVLLGYNLLGYYDFNNVFLTR